MARKNELTLRCQQYSYFLTARHMEDKYFGERVSRLGLARAIQRARKTGDAKIPGSWTVILQTRGAPKKTPGLLIGCRWFPPIKAKKVMAWAAAGAMAHARAKRKTKKQVPVAI